MLWFTMLSVGASAADGSTEVPLNGASGLVVRGVEGDVEVVAGVGDAVTVSGGDARLVRKGDVWVVTVKDGGPELALRVTVPASLAALTIHEQVGRLVIRDLPTRVAVVSGTGPVEVAGASSLRVSHNTGDVLVDRIADDLIVDQLTGTLDVNTIGGDVVVDGVNGIVTVDDVVGNLAVSGAPAGVHQTNVRGQVSL